MEFITVKRNITTHHTAVLYMHKEDIEQPYDWDDMEQDIKMTDVLTNHAPKRDWRPMHRLEKIKRLAVRRSMRGDKDKLPSEELALFC